MAEQGSDHRYITPAKRTRGLGAAREGTEHFIRQRVSAMVLAVLVPWFIYAALEMASGTAAGARVWLAQPWNAFLMIAVLGAAFFHMRLGMQTIIEDYIHGSGPKRALLILNSLAALALFAVAALSVARIWFTGGLLT